MPLIDEFRQTLLRLASAGWRPAFETLGIDPESTTLRQDLLRDVPDRAALQAWPGFEDAAPEAMKPIDPRRPGRSLLLHALASPSVTTLPDGTVLTAFPTAADLDLAENVVFGIVPPALSDLRGLFPGMNLAIAVYAREYRQRRGTVHARHADMVFARTGVARVGTLDPHWDGARRSFSPLEPGDDPFAFRTLPCRYAVYLAVQRKGDPGDFGPFRADRTFTAAQRFNQPPQSTVRDAGHDFWVPVHKLFSGPDCLRDVTLDVALVAGHVNEKLRRIHLANMGAPRGMFDSGFGPPEIDAAPFVDEDLAGFLDPAVHGAGTLAAKVRQRLVEPAVAAGKPAGAFVPPNRAPLAASFNIPAATPAPGSGRARQAPEWLHVRTQLKRDGSERDLNEFETVETVVNDGRIGNASPYRARHYADFTGDGWIAARVSGLPGNLVRHVPAYSILAAPDFYPYVSQSDLLDWSINDVPSNLRGMLWETPPLTLCDQRSAPNLSLRSRGAPFVPEDATVTAIVGLSGSASGAADAGSARVVPRATYLPDGAAGVYAPGWDTSLDFDDASNTWHLAAHGLGSPFPEDAKLCAAISAFWPSSAPDTSRSYGVYGRWRIVAPMTDREIGLEDAPPWDGIPGPRVVRINGVDHLEDDDFAHVDYVRQALAGRFTLSQTMTVDQDEYQARIIATQRMFLVLRQQFGSETLRMLSFKAAGADDPDRLAARGAREPLAGQVYKFVMVSTDSRRPLTRHADDPARWLVHSRISGRVVLLADETGQVLFRIDNGSWQTAPAS